MELAYLWAPKIGLQVIGLNVYCVFYFKIISIISYIVFMHPPSSGRLEVMFSLILYPVRCSDPTPTSAFTYFASHEY